MDNDNIKIVIETNKEGLTLKDINRIRENFNSLSDENFIHMLEGSPTIFNYKSKEAVKFMRLPIGSKIVEELDDHSKPKLLESGEGCVKLVSIKPINPIAFAEDVIEDMLLQATAFPSDKEFEKYKEAIESRKGEIVERVRELLPAYLSDCITEMQQQVASDLLNKITEII